MVRGGSQPPSLRHTSWVPFYKAPLLGQPHNGRLLLYRTPRTLLRIDPKTDPYLRNGRLPEALQLLPLRPESPGPAVSRHHRQVGRSGTPVSAMDRRSLLTANKLGVRIQLESGR